MSGADRPRETGIDPDAATMSPARSVHLQPGLIAVVAVGGVLGTAVRAGLALAWPPIDAVPVATLAVNLVGAFVLGLLLEALARRGPDEGRRRRARLFFGTGLLGGFTTYSSLATESAVLLLHGSAGLAAAYAIGTVLLGGGATWLGILLASRRGAA